VFISAAAVAATARHGAMYGPRAGLITELFPTCVRYSGASMGYQLAGVLGGALAPIVASRWSVGSAHRPGHAVRHRRARGHGRRAGIG